MISDPSPPMADDKDAKVGKPAVRIQERARLTPHTLIHVPPSFLCPITMDLMREPVTCADGHSYERAAIERWLEKGHRTSPSTGAELPHKTLTPNHTMRKTIEEWRDQHFTTVTLLELARFGRSVSQPRVCCFHRTRTLPVEGMSAV